MRTIGVLVFPGFELLDVFGPLEMFGILEDEFKIDLVAQNAGPVKSSHYSSVHPDAMIGDGTRYDILFVPGGRGVRQLVDNAVVLDWIRDTSQAAEYTLSVCSGSALLAKAGLLENRRATTNKASFEWIASQGPNVVWVRQARWVEDGPFITSSGVSAGMDMALAAISIMHGTERAEKVAEICEYSWHRDSAWDPFAKIHGLV